MEHKTDTGQFLCYYFFFSYMPPIIKSGYLHYLTFFASTLTLLNHLKIYYILLCIFNLLSCTCQSFLRCCTLLIQDSE